MELQPSRLLAIRTDRSLIPPQWTLAQAIAQSVGAGANLVLLAEEDLPRPVRLILARFVRDAVRNRCPWIIVGDAPLAQEAGADGFCTDASITGSHCRACFLLHKVEDTFRRAGNDTGEARLFIAELPWNDPERALGELRAMCERMAGASVLAGTDPPLEYVGDIIASGAQGVLLCAAAMDARARGERVRAYADLLFRGIESG